MVLLMEISISLERKKRHMQEKTMVHYIKLAQHFNQEGHSYH